MDPMEARALEAEMELAYARVQFDKLTRELKAVYEAQRHLAVDYVVPPEAWETMHDRDAWYDRMIRHLAQKLTTELIQSGCVNQRFERSKDGERKISMYLTVYR